MKAIAAGKTVDLLDTLAAPKKVPVRLGMECPWPDTLARALRDDGPSFFGTDESMEGLARSLVAFGGWRLVDPGFDEDLLKITARGQLWSGHGAVRAPGTPSQCHRNSALCWEANADRLVLATGYALSADGLWRQHSWCVKIDGNKPRIVETTERRVAYFGFVMTLPEAVMFYEAQTGCLPVLGGDATPADDDRSPAP